VVYIPDRGDLIWLTFDPQAGREQSKRRPALVLSPKRYNQLTSLCIVCPITTKIKGYPFEVAVKTKKENAVILADQVKSLDWTCREATYYGKVSSQILAAVGEKLALLLSLGKP
jgi:mRNA interferase MazF